MLDTLYNKPVNSTMLERLRVLNPADYVSHVFDFKDIDKAFEKIHNRESTMKMIIKF